ncbi:MAG: HAD-IIIA family hydrolase [Deltaproteobacteria bacterium]|nr:HAD-IIIA family hydrolase [Deltaproteobacteria bacterium]MBN2672041.1 HAD-IIIA family hydrolase [Deltaproteobacteria bacterium]
MTPVSDQVRALAEQIELVILDVDGVLTDGTLAYTETGEQVKNFNAKDGFGIRMMQESGIEVAVITARKSPPLARRMNDLKIRHFFTGFDNKIDAYQQLISQLQLPPGHVAYVGDDVLDLPVMRQVGLPIAVGDAHFYAKETALWTTTECGGHGAVREVADMLISCRQNLYEAYDRFLNQRVGKSDLDKV